MPEPLNVEVYERIVKDLEGMRGKLLSAKDLRDALKEVGEDVSELNITIRDLETKIGRWDRMLRNRGYID